MLGDEVVPINQRPLVVVHSFAGGLAIAVVESLLGNFCRVRVVSGNPKEWQVFAPHLFTSGAVNTATVSKEALLEGVDYGVFLYSNKNLRDIKEAEKEAKRLREVVDYFTQKEKKLIIVFPFFQDKALSSLYVFTSKLLSKNPLVGVFCTGELFGPRMSFEEDSFVQLFFKGAVNNDPVFLPKEDILIYPAFIKDVARELVRNLLSFGIFGERVLVSSAEITPRKFSEIARKTIRLKDEVFTKTFIYPPPAVVDEQVVLNTRLEQAIKETIDWLSLNKKISVPHLTAQQKKETEEKKGTPVIEKTIKRPFFQKGFKIPHKKWLFRGLFFLIAFLLLNPAILLLSSSSLAFAASRAKEGDLKTAKKAAFVSKALAKPALSEAQFLTTIPLVGGVFSSSQKNAKILVEANGVAEKLITAADLSRDLIEKIFGEEDYEASFYSERIALELDAAYKELAFIEPEIETLGGFVGKVARHFIETNDLAEIRAKLLVGKKIAENIPSLLGQDKQKVYLFLFQNNMELRPTGGFIGSYALVTFDRGRLVDINVSDVYVADGQLKGYVEPPSPIREYLGEASWFLRDSNWDPDFSVSAQTAEWFLGKELGVSVDGVVGVDLEVARKIIKEVGSLYLPDYDREISYENMYEVTQYEVEKDFFPGSYKKTNFLTSLTRALVGKLKESTSSNFAGVARAVFESLEERHLQIFIHEKQVQRALSDAIWDGGVYQPVCSGNCFSDWLGLVEANVGVNKANYFVKRRMSLVVVFDEGVIRRFLTVSLENTASPALSKTAKYKTYMRLLAPGGAVLNEVEIVGAGERQTMLPEVKEIRGRKEAGVLIELNPGQKKSATFSWEESTNLDFTKKGEYRLYWRKQAGTGSDPVVVKLFFPGNVLPNSTPPFSLTREEGVGYNTTLSRDFVSRIYWNK